MVQEINQMMVMISPTSLMVLVTSPMMVMTNLTSLMVQETNPMMAKTSQTSLMAKSPTRLAKASANACVLRNPNQTTNQMVPAMTVMTNPTSQTVPETSLMNHPAMMAMTSQTNLTTNPQPVNPIWHSLWMLLVISQKVNQTMLMT